MSDRIFVHCDTCGLDALVPLNANVPAGIIVHCWLAAHDPPKVTKADLQPDVRRALRHGCGHTEDHEPFSAGPK